MIPRIPFIARVPRKIKRTIRRMRPYTAGMWDLGTVEVKEFKTVLKARLLALQKHKCAYCGLDLEETSQAEIEHIVPKGGTVRPVHPKLAFTTVNLALSCSFCNGRSKKGTKDIIRVQNLDYRKCEFLIVHPLLDDPDEHYSWAPGGDKIVIAAKSRKGGYSIGLFKLYTLRHAEARAKQVLYEHMREHNARLLEDIVTRKVGV